jgi:dipeptidyl aminopeptidase/acylaminoacyl peptidase
MKRLAIAVTIAAAARLALAAADPITARHPVQLSSEASVASADILRKAHVEAITYMSDGLRIHGYLAVPNGDGPFPCVIFNRGGNSSLSVFDDAHAVASLGKLATWGYIAVASQYRGAGGGEGRDEFGGADVDDVLNLIPVLESLPSADRTRIGMYGVSRGGMMTYLALARTDRIRAAVVVSGLSDLFENGRARPEMEANFKRFMPDYATSREDALARRSAVRWADKLPPNVPLLLVHGTADWRVGPSEAFDMARALYLAKRPIRLVMFEGGSHGVPEFAAERDAQIRAFLDTYLRDGSKWPDLTPHGK